MQNLKTQTKRVSIWVLAVAMIWVVAYRSVRADQLTNRSIEVYSSQSSVVTLHEFSYNILSTESVGSIVFEYCENSPLPSASCSAPAGLDVSSAVLDSESGETGFIVDPLSTANRLIITRLPSVTATGPNQYVFSNITNPSLVNQTTYVRISLHGSTDGTGPSTDEGSVAFATANRITTTAFVPPFLIFCVGVTVASDCSSSSGSFIDLGELSKTLANAGTSQYAGATNDATGFNVSIFGSTLTSGTNFIPALTSPSPSIPGTSQFGINLRDNSVPDAGQNRTGTGTSVATSNYNTTNSFMFVSGGVISSSPLPTNFNVFTVTYLANVSPAQMAGIYNSTFTYIAVASF
jgi:hypothetical protein